MKRGIFDTLRRGVDNTIANWQISAIRFSEVVLFGLIAILSVIAMLIPIFVRLGIRLAEISTPDQAENAMIALLENWTMFLWFGAGLLLMLTIFALIHSYVEAGCARVFVDADRAAGAEVAGPRERYRQFSVTRWLDGAKDGGWRVFWIYNLAYGLALLILMIPLLVIAALLLLLRENPAAGLAVGCFGMILFVLVAIPVGIATAMWTKRAIADWAVQRSNARESLASGWRAVKADLGRHVLVMGAIIVAGLAGSSVFSTFSMFGSFGRSFGDQATFSIMTAPMQIIGSILSSAFSTLIGSWFLASYSALAAEKKP